VTVYVATTAFHDSRDEDDWDHVGRRFRTYIDGIASSEDKAKGFALDCSEDPVRWFRLKRYAMWAGKHRNWNTSPHFHMVDCYTVDEA
jgi:hypothetical protein